MILNADNLNDIKYNTKTVKLEKADAEVCVALIPSSLVTEAKEKKDAGGDMDKVGFEILKKAVVDENGNPVFNTPESFESLPAAIQAEITDAVWDYNGLGDNGDLEKNSEAT